MCQLRVEFLDLSLAPPNGDGVCSTDVISISGGASNIPILCGENSGQHVVVDFDGTNSISITVSSLSTFTFGRHWFIRATQLNCDSANRGTISPNYFEYFFQFNFIFVTLSIIYTFSLNDER